MWKKPEDETPSQSVPPSNPATAPRPAAPEPRRGGSATLGESIRVQGEIHGDEDLVIEGEVDGSVHLDKHSVTVGRSGRVKADIHGRTLFIDGKVQGNLFAEEQVVVRASGEVRGNITSPRVSLEDGSKFKGSIDMEPRAASRPPVADSKSGAERKDDPKEMAAKASSSSSAPSGGASGGPSGGASPAAGTRGAVTSGDKSSTAERGGAGSA